MEESGWLLLEKKAVLGSDKEMFDEINGADEGVVDRDGFARTISFKCDDCIVSSFSFFEKKINMLDFNLTFFFIFLTVLSLSIRF